MYELDCAVINGRIDIAYVLSHHATSNTFILAIKCGRLEIIQIFTKVRPLPVGAHILAIKYGHLHILQWMHNVLNLFTIADNLVYIAICYGRYDILTWLISIGYPVDVGDGAVVAGCYQHIGMVDWIVDSKLSYIDPIELASLHGDAAAVKSALSNGISYTNVAIWWAAANGHLEVLKCFNGISFNLTLLKYAVSSGNLELIKWMYPNYRDKNVFINEAVWHNKIEILQWICERADVGISTILKAVEYGYVDVIKWLFKVPNNFTKLSIGKMHKKAVLFGQLELQEFLKNKLDN